ncbi:MAG: glycoside hydrolase family 65 protein [Deltaproteobacteria bacterium]|nr:glycoside hydrolase family 65 protein [Deltaproteobacteria bacterium]MCW5805754.1 glycoside hydrolase family 65 protein [Deltaproteobacteria bacterium]
MISHPSIAVEPWAVREASLSLDHLARTESLFALSNGHLGVRGNFDEGEPHGVPGTYLNGVYELHPLPYAEPNYGSPESGQTMINVTNGKVIRLLVGDEPFDLRYGDLRAHERVLDLRAGTLRRTVVWESPAHRTVRVTSTRLVSFTQRAILAISYEVEPLDGPTGIVVQSELVANEPVPIGGKDPREASALESPLESEHHACLGTRAVLAHRTRRSGLRIAAMMEHEARGTAHMRASSETTPDVARYVVTDSLQPGQRLRLEKLVAYGWSEQRTTPTLHDQVAAAVSVAREAGWDGLLAEQRAYLDDFWSRADVEIEGDSELQQAMRFALFHVLSSSARAERRGIPSKGLTGTGYDGHSFWDMDMYVVALLTYTMPSVAADALRWRQSILPAAEARSQALGHEGAAYPWRTIHGEEGSGYWPSGTAAFHINADIANAVLRYVRVTGDVQFERDVAVEILVKTARLWRSLGHHDLQGNFRIDGVTGPDEYSALADNNVYTNLMARRNLVGAAEVCARHVDRARELAVTSEEMALWRAAADRVTVPYDERIQIHPQAEGFTEHELWDFERTAPDQYPLLLHFTYFDLYRKQVVKQPDLVLAMVMCPETFTHEQVVRNFDYYERITVRDSSLAAVTQAVVAAECDYLRLAFDYAAEATLIDLQDLEHNVADGLHMASLAGAWIAFVFGFGGMRDHGEVLAFGPKLPDGLTRYAFTITRRNQRLHVDVGGGRVEYRLVDGGTFQLTHHGEPLTVTADAPVTRPLLPAPPRPPPQQPPGREPRRRSPG